MKARAAAWVVVIGCVWLGSQAVARWSSPWSVPASPILSVLPAQPDGCGEKCK